MTVPTITTERLVLREWRDTDLDAYAALCADPEVMRYIGPGAPQDRARAAEAMRSFTAGWEEHGFGLWCLADARTDTCLGFTGLAVPDFLPEVMPAVEIGWRLARHAWGRGYATEAAQVTVAYAFDTVGLDRLVSIAVAGNDASTNVMRKIGMHLERATVHPEHGMALVVYELRRTTA